MSGWYVRTARDAGVQGHALDSAESSPEDPILDQRLDALLMHFGGLPESRLGDHSLSDEVPVVSAQYVEDLGRWAMLLRGINGKYGAGGTTQTSLAPEYWGLRRAWSAYFAALARKAWVSPRDPRLMSDRSLSADVRDWDVVARGLRAMIAESTVIRLGTADRIVYVVARMLDVLPERAARTFVWSTVHVARRIEPTDRVITALWPDQFREVWGHAYDRLRFYLEADEANVQLSRTDRYSLIWLREELQSRAVPGERPYLQDLSSLSQVLTKIGETRRLFPEEMADAVRRGSVTEHERSSILAGSPAWRQLVEKEPELIVGLLEWPDRDLREHAVLSLWQASAGQRVLVEKAQKELITDSFPIAKAAAALPLRDRESLARRVYRGRLRDPDYLSDTREWVLALGLSQTQSPEFFPMGAAEAARFISTDDVDRALACLQDSRDPANLLREALVSLNNAPEYVSRVLCHVLADPTWIAVYRPASLLAPFDDRKSLDWLTPFLDEADRIMRRVSLNDGTLAENRHRVVEIVFNQLERDDKVRNSSLLPLLRFASGRSMRESLVLEPGRDSGGRTGATAETSRGRWRRKQRAQMRPAVKAASKPGHELRVLSRTVILSTTALLVALAAVAMTLWIWLELR
jgi:hypothetical protein